jgi:hypothetical protein
LLTDRNIIEIVEEKSTRWFPSKKAAKYGGTMRYIPRRRVVGWQIREDPQLDLHVLELSTGKGAEKLEIPFSARRRSGAQRIIDQVVNRSAA